MTTEQYRSRIPGFYRLPFDVRRTVVQKQMALEPNVLQAFLPQNGLAVEAADMMVENALGVFGLPVGIALNFLVDDVPVVVPMAIEEPSVVAACSHIARLVGAGGGFHTEVDPSHMIGQIQLVCVPDLDRAIHAIEQNRLEIMTKANAFCPSMVARGGGCIDVRARVLPPVTNGIHAAFDSREKMIVVDVVLNCCDAMGANIINTVMEGISPRVAELANGQASLRILSNLADRRLARAYCQIPYRLLALDEGRDFGAQVAEAIVNAYRFAARDPYRACTHNKGIMNGIDALAIATGNDWRAIEAGAHAYACREGRYSSLTRFETDDKKQLLKGFIELPLAVGVVGGSTKAHPAVQASLRMIGPFGESARSLSRLMASVGLAQNLSALRALVCEGIQKGHMELHRRKGGEPA